MDKEKLRERNRGEATQGEGTRVADEIATSDARNDFAELEDFSDPLQVETYVTKEFLIEMNGDAEVRGEALMALASEEPLLLAKGGVHHAILSKGH